MIANSSTTVVVSGTTYYHHNPWYRKVLYEGEEGYVLTSAPVGYETKELPEGSEKVEFEGKEYSYHEGAFYQDNSSGGYVSVLPPVGVEVSSIPKETVKQEEGDTPLYQFDKVFFTKVTNESGKEVYRVEPSPPSEKVSQVPGDTTSFVADGVTYYYIDFSLYVEQDENGKKEYVNAEPEIGAQLEDLPKGSTTIEEDGKTFYQFDMLFFEQVEDENGKAFYEVVGSPDGSEAVELD